MKKGIFWFRRDLRLSDNRGLAKALHEGDAVYPIFIFDSDILDKIKNKSDPRVTLIYKALNELREELKKLNSDLHIFHGLPREIIPKLVSEEKIDFVYANRDYEHYAKKRDKEIRDILQKRNTSFETFKDHVIFEPNEVLKDDGTPYQVYSAYRKRWYETLENNIKVIGEFKLKKSSLSEFKRNSSNIEKLSDFGFQEDNELVIKEFGEKETQKRWKKFSNIISNYDKDRDFPAKKGTSELSIALRFGTISTRKLVRETYPEISESNGKKIWLDEIIWREFYQMILGNFPEVEKEPFLKKFKTIKFPGSKDLFKKWCEGKTGFPIIDASMRCFNQTGLMHNRLRMVVGSFLVKTLMVDYRLGEKYFEEKLLDFDKAANNGGWQWVASTGCDASPYFRIFNPSNQSIKFDPQAEFILQYCPELKGLPLKKIHEPWKASDEEQVKGGCLLEKDYPYPVVDYSENRKRVLEVYKNL